MLERFEVELDHADAVAFAEQILEGWQRSGTQGGRLSKPSERERNLALVFLDMKYPYQCCGEGGRASGPQNDWADLRCEDCPMRSHDWKGEKIEADPGRR